ncbi:16S rRNA pseudouridine(516) synthase RsuA [Pseudoalteromonas sp. B28]|jgi:16S rRNA pseudouridine516 synthase|uniref:Pseudouridine synthase n=1 Tax=Pseudoalteromonas distincta TaxID=77608 RepID=A0A4P9IXT2_9GAMM|nr:MULTISPECIES: 16S rRNA pseudouridine(516) synthase RsuA [Pseudoalteromonas]KAA1162983.1 16S rRNA pseudouridine(516) synthase RsuA [Pseudoalteromonas distincta]MBB1304040.1 16S rRNA pseudouridine(516) synthase RsuA [Pseudoalteromonas sp. SR43-5]MBB1354861.1 16S rRNA pseudouridine(516) synthase RsuA [Pseudoalteromonas sp. SR45-5]MBB1429392.1 16S rRNA pseudouridine(516) synthase RsuA [Pseudoalteromonas sp. SG43-4]MBB1456708.1 16S rRNA pseudouridine(516) synthase RsuA [Pseudoalteromonas sp. SG4|tara:strand:+ start:113 stop:811 length:699 start_codon:yes stop_codon:yes gene_type:complete
MKFPCRLDKFISHLAEIPRTQARASIKRKEVSVNGEVITSHNFQLAQQDEVLHQGTPLVFLGKRYYMLNKPVGYVCANSDELHKTVFDLLDEPNMSDFHVAGRLDIDTTGLVIITNDGDWSHKITSPKSNKFKTYLVETQEPITDEALEQLRTGVMLHNEKDLTRPAIAERLANYGLRLSISEGKYHQVKRMLYAVDNKVVELHREQIAGITLDENLASGEYRLLTPEEIKL